MVEACLLPKPVPCRGLLEVQLWRGTRGRGGGGNGGVHRTAQLRHPGVDGVHAAVDPLEMARQQ